MVGIHKRKTPKPVPGPHRPSALKQQNKKHHKLGHRSKRQVDRENHGKISEVKIIAKSKKTNLKREQRREQANQIRASKREIIIAKKRQFGTESSPPFLVAVIPLSVSINTNDAVKYVSQNEDLLDCQMSQQGILHFSSGRLKQRFSFITPPSDNLYAMLDALKICDSVLFLWKIGEEFRPDKDVLLSALRSQGIPTSFHGVIGTEEFPYKKKMRLLKELQFIISNFFSGGQLRLFLLNEQSEVSLLLRQIGSQKRAPIFFRDVRSNLMAEEIEYIGEGSTGMLKLGGYVRGQPLSVNGLVHLPGWGDFQLEKIEAKDDPFPLVSSNPRRKPDTPKSDSYLLDAPDQLIQQTLQSIFEVDPMEGEQTWPTEEELAEAETAVRRAKVVKGTSSYQAAWYVDGSEEEDEEDEEDQSDDADDMEPDAEGMDCGLSVGEDRGAESDSTDDEDVNSEFGEDDLVDVENDYDQNVDYESEMETLRKIKDAKEDQEFPDEMDTPLDIPARVRFQKFRGLQSFRSSLWNKDENLPIDYGRISRFRNFVHTKNRIFSEDREGASPGMFVILYLRNVSRYSYDDYVKNGGGPLAAVAMLPFEQRMSVMNVVMRSAKSHTVAVKSKERLVFHVGYRRFANCPIFSEHTNGNKYKYLRFFNPGDIAVASMYAPIFFPQCPVTIFKQFADRSLELVATGSVMSMNPDRIVCKRIALSGHLLKFNKKSSVVRYMFHNPEDVKWFKSIELYTKTGRRGHIKDSLGTRGHMKCIFDGPLSSTDVVFMNLFKRVFPKWRFDSVLSVPQMLSNDCEEESDEEMDADKRGVKKVSFNIDKFFE